MTQRILVTGGAGFIGSHVVEHLLARGDEVHVLDDLSKGHVAYVPPESPLYVLDMSESPLERVFAGTPFDAVVHCAAQTNVMRSVGDPELDRKINVDGLKRVLDGAIATDVRRFVFISSGGAIYGETPSAATESTEPRPENPYGRHKLEGEPAHIGGVGEGLEPAREGERLDTPDPQLERRRDHPLVRSHAAAERHLVATPLELAAHASGPVCVGGPATAGDELEDPHTRLR